MTVLNIIRDCLDALLHPSARYDALTQARHRAFMAPRLLGSLAAFAAFPLYLAHGLVLSAWLALRPAARDGVELVPMLAAVVLLTWGLGRLSDPLRDRIERGLLWLSGRLGARVLQGQPGRLGK